MNTKHISLAFAAVAALLAGCTKNPFEASSASNGLSDLELSSVNSVQTRSAIDVTTFPETGEIGLFLFKDELANTPYGESGYTNVKYSYNEEKEKWTASPSIKVGSAPGYLYGYYPYKAGTQEQPISVKAIPVKSSLNGDDVMYATPVKDVTDANASQTSITMNHALARVSITVKNKGYTGDAKLTKIQFGGAQTAETGTLNALDGSIIATKSDVTLDVTDDAKTITAAGTTYECLLVPSEVETSKQTVALTLTIDGQEKTATLSGDNGVIIAQNTKSNITLTLSDSGISVQTVSIDDWNVVEVGGHKVTVEEASEITANDILSKIYAVGNTTKIDAVSKSGMGLNCTVTGDASCEKTKAGNIYTFTISNITSDITATIGYQYATGVNLNKTEASLAIGDILILTATLIPDDACSEIAWTSSDEGIASVENGTVTAKKEGTAIITATTDDGGKTATCTVKVEGRPSDSLPGIFSVSEDKKIYFSRGNLYCRRTSLQSNEWTWQFYDNQYEFLAADMALTTENPSRTVSSNETEIHLFTWGYSSRTSFDPIGYDYVTTYSTDGEQLIYDKPSSEGGDDWGVAYCESNGIGVGAWRTLTTAEWQYLFNYDGTTDSFSRIDYSNDIRKDKYKSGVIVCGSKECVILLPDNWDENVISLETFATKTEYSEETTPKWSTMEAAGAVCLPATGARVETASQYAGQIMYYWSSTSAGYSKNIGSHAAYTIMQLIEGNFFPSGNIFSSYGCSVRLVSDYPGEPDAE